jgi:hypothetical protein
VVASAVSAAATLVAAAAAVAGNSNSHVPKRFHAE